jgi:hypothetical protein
MQAECDVADPDVEAAGASSRRLRYVSKDRVDFGCFSRTSVKSASGGNCHRENAFVPEVARHQSVHDRAARLLDEERYLCEHLPGYREYRRQVTSRLLPRIW